MQGKMAKGFSIESMVRDNIRKLVPYSSARNEYSGPASVFLDANENPYNAPLNRYPDPRQAQLKGRIAAMRGQEPANLFLGNGSDEAIDLLIRVLCEPGQDKIITVDPTYGMYGVCAAVNNVEHKRVLLREDFSLDPEAVMEAVDAQTKIIFLCSPNNPTSNSLKREALLSLIAQAPCFVVVDEAYIDFSRNESLLSSIPDLENLVVLQTLSKAWGLAGIRVGMAYAHPDLVAYLSAVKYPYNLNTLSLNKAMDALDRAAKEPLPWVGEILGERDRMASRLASLDFVRHVYPSDANFLLIRVDRPKEVYHFLVERGIIVRDRSSVPLCSGCLRITVGTAGENRKLLDALEGYAQTFTKI
jgi:histidinol-phosphate aminotransferase